MDSNNSVVPLSKARAKLGDLTDKVSGENYVVLTKGGTPKAAIVDIKYLNKLQQQLRSIYQKTYIDPKLIPYTREFSKEEIQRWLKEDAL